MTNKTFRVVMAKPRRNKPKIDVLIDATTAMEAAKKIDDCTGSYEVTDLHVTISETAIYKGA